MIVMGAIALGSGILLLVESMRRSKGDFGSHFVPLAYSAFFILGGAALLVYGGWRHDWIRSIISN
jgi:hypothetical protein